MKGIAYNPIPAAEDSLRVDVMADAASLLWSRDGRADMKAIGTLGANTVRTRGNNPSLDHKLFLDEAQDAGLDVVTELPTETFLAPGTGCLHTRQDCYEQVKEAYLQNLRRGFLDEKGEYHPALRTMVILDEPENVFTPMEAPWLFCKAVLSALDGVLDAEKEAGFAGGPAPNFSVPFSFIACPWCLHRGDIPALGRMLELRAAMRNPPMVGYQPRNDLWSAYVARFENSFNVNDSLKVGPGLLQGMLAEYRKTLPEAPIFVSEFDVDASTHHLGKKLQDVLEVISVAPGAGAVTLRFQAHSDPAEHGAKDFARNAPLALFRTAGVEAKTRLTLEGQTASGSSSHTYPIWCLTPAQAADRQKDDSEGVTSKVAQAFGGSAPKPSCRAASDSVVAQ
jgi:hypothetical protein